MKEWIITFIVLFVLFWGYVGVGVTTHHYALSRQAKKGNAVMSGFFWPVALPFIATADIVEEHFGMEDPADKNLKPEAEK